MTATYSIDEASNSLDSVILRLAMACESGDKELEVFTDALSTAIDQLKDNPEALSKVAQAAKDALGDDLSDISFCHSQTDIHDLNAFCHCPTPDTFQLAFDIDFATTHQQVRIINNKYTEESIIEGLKTGELLTTTWFEKGAVKTIDIADTGTAVAEIVSQEVDGEYGDFR